MIIPGTARPPNPAEAARALSELQRRAKAARGGTMKLTDLKGLQASLHLNFDQEPKPTRKGYGDQIVELAKKHPEIMVLCADLTESTTVNTVPGRLPRQVRGDRGRREQNLVTVASGLAHVGKIPSCQATPCSAQAAAGNRSGTPSVIDHRISDHGRAHSGDLSPDLMGRPTRRSRMSAS